jgi:hypothetical protein
MFARASFLFDPAERRLTKKVYMKNMHLHCAKKPSKKHPRERRLFSTDQWLKRELDFDAGALAEPARCGFRAVAAVTTVPYRRLVSVKEQAWQNQPIRNSRRR